jgi:hypothetical protein
MYDEDQLYYINCNTKNNVVVGNPGSGKSTALKGRIDKLIQNGCKKSSQLVMTFYLTTKENLTTKLKEVFGNETKNQVRTVHSICYNMLSEQSKDVTTAIVRVLRIPAEIFAIHFKDISHIYIDEGQLLDSTAIDLVKKIRTCCPWISVDLIGDPAQNCKTEVNDESEEFMIQYNGPKYELVNNYRSVLEIVDFCNESHPFNIRKPMKSKREGTGSVSLFCGSREEQFKHLFDLLDSLPKHESKVIMCACRHPHTQMKTHVCCQDVANLLDEMNVEFSIWYDENKSKSEFSSVRREESNLVISTIQGTLGREFDHGIQFSYHHRLNKRTPTRKQHYHNKKLNNIARSRARYTFTMLCGPDMDMFMTCEKALKMVRCTGKRPKIITNTFKKGVFVEEEEEDDKQIIKLGSLNTTEPVVLMKVQDLFSIKTIDKRNLWSIESQNFPDYDVLCTLYGKFAENCIYSFSCGSFPDRDALKTFTEGNTILVNDGETEEAQYIMKELNLIERRMSIASHHVEELKKKAMRLYKSNITQKKMKRARFFSSVIDVIDFILEKANGDRISIHFKNRNIWCDMDVLNDMMSQESTPFVIFNLSLFWWQYENQAAWRMSRDYSSHLQSLSKHINAWRSFASTTNLNYQIPVVLLNSKFCNKKIMGAVDGISEESLFEFKFSPSGTSNIHKLQAVLYSYALNQNTNVNHNTKVVNLCTGEIESLNYDFVLSDDVFQIFFCKTDCEDVDQECDDPAAMTILPFSIVPF